MPVKHFREIEKTKITEEDKQRQKEIKKEKERLFGYAIVDGNNLII